MESTFVHQVIVKIFQNTDAVSVHVGQSSPSTLSSDCAFDFLYWDIRFFPSTRGIDVKITGWTKRMKQNSRYPLVWLKYWDLLSVIDTEYHLRSKNMQRKKVTDLFQRKDEETENVHKKIIKLALTSTGRRDGVSWAGSCRPFRNTHLDNMSNTTDHTIVVCPK